MRQYSLVIISLFILAASISSSQAQSFQGPRADIDQILEKANAFSQAFIRGDHDAMTALYTVDAKIFPGKADIIEGHEAIRERWKLPKGQKILFHKITPREINILDDHAYDYGYYVGQTQLEDGKQVSWKGKYVIVWKKIEGEWKMYLDIWNRVE